jgi:hypothetical protein
MSDNTPRPVQTLESTVQNAGSGTSLQSPPEIVDADVCDVPVFDRMSLPADRLVKIVSVAVIGVEKVVVVVDTCALVDVTVVDLVVLYVCDVCDVMELVTVVEEVVQASHRAGHSSSTTSNWHVNSLN